MAYHVRTKEFDGPLELLLNLIESKKLSINEISLGSVTEEYFRYLETFKREDAQIYHREIAGFLVIAATLMLIKSRSLLAGFVLTLEEEADIKELEERLQVYKAIKEAAGELAIRVKNRHPLYTRKSHIIAVSSFLPPPKPPDLTKMLGLLRMMIESIPQKQELPAKTIKKIVSIEEKIKELQKRIEDGAVRTFHDFVSGKKEKVEVIISFLAMLELIKLGIIAVRQSVPFDLIYIKHGTGKSA